MAAWWIDTIAEGTFDLKLRLQIFKSARDMNASRRMSLQMMAVLSTAESYGLTMSCAACDGLARALSGKSERGSHGAGVLCRRGVLSLSV